MDELRPTDPLRNEHAEVLGKLTTLETLIQYPDKGAETLPELRKLAAFFQTDFWVHFTKEEEALFPEMEKYAPRDHGPIGVMLAEHVELRRNNDAMQAAFSSFLADAGNLGAKELMKEHGGHFISGLRDHIDKENKMLFVMAESWLDEAQKRQVAKRCREIEAGQPAGTGAGN